MLITPINYSLNQKKKIHVVNKILHKIKNETLKDYTSEFEMVGDWSIGDHVREIQIRFRNMDDFEGYIKAKEGRYEAEDAFFNKCIYKINTHLLNLVNRSQYGNSCDFKSWKYSISR